MKGKNLGKTHQRRSRLSRAQPPKPGDLAFQQDGTGQEGAGGAEHLLERLSGSPHQLALYKALPLPLLVEATPRSLDTIRDCEYYAF